MEGITKEMEHKKNPELKEEDLNYLKEWIKKQDHLPQNIPDNLLILFLHSCYYRLEPTKQTLDTYFTVRTHVTEFFINRSITRNDVSEAIKTAYILPLNGTTPAGYKVLLCRLLRTDPSLYVFADAMKVFTMITDVWLYLEGSAPGHVIVLDMAGVSFGHVTRLSLGVMKKILFYLQEAMPVRLKGFHYINIVPFMDTIMGMMKPFMKKELIDMLQFHPTGSETLFSSVPKDLLPNEYGGKGGSLQELQEKWVKNLESCSLWFEQDENLRVNESKRTGASKSASQLFGVEGSFKKLSID